MQIRLSVVSFYEGLELLFGCILEKVNDISKVLSLYVDEAEFDGVPVFLQYYTEIPTGENHWSIGVAYHIRTVHYEKCCCQSIDNKASFYDKVNLTTNRLILWLNLKVSG